MRIKHLAEYWHYIEIITFLKQMLCAHQKLWHLENSMTTISAHIFK